MKSLKQLAFCSLLLTAPFATTLSFANESFLPKDVSQQMKPQTIKILLADKQNGAYLDVTGAHKIYNPSSGFLISDEKNAKAAPITLSKDGIFWKEKYPAVVQMRIVPYGTNSSIVINGTQYKGCVEIYEVGGRIAIVNEVDIENFLKTTLSKEKITATHPEVLNSIAIVARTHFYHHVAQNKNTSWHLSSKEVGYDGCALTHQNFPFEKAIEATRYVVMTYQGAPFATTWTADSAGKTASYASIFRKNSSGPAGTTFAASMKDREARKWRFTISKDELAQKLQMKEIANVDLFVDKSTDKVYGIKTSDGSSFKSVDFFTFQKAIGSQRLKSNEFQVRVEKDKVHFEGYGEGTGVGLCLYSAKMLADHGKTASDILKTFYPGAKLESIRSWDELSKASTQSK